jgi:hypothetical protein
MEYTWKSANTKTLLSMFIVVVHSRKRHGSRNDLSAVVMWLCIAGNFWLADNCMAVFSIIS